MICLARNLSRTFINQSHNFPNALIKSSNNIILNQHIQNASTDSSKKICIVGSGPAALYTAQYIMKTLPDVKKTIDIYEKLPVPFGLVRYGVAPDHQDVKNVINSFTDTLRNDNVNFFGNIGIGTDLQIKELTNAYNCVVLAYGSHSENYLNVPGEKDFTNFISAKDFVSWYNGLPGGENFQVDLSGSNAVIIGAGNVALDIARILLSPIEKLETTDISAEAIDTIKRTNKINNVTIVARRGILNAAFTIKELRELTKIETIRCEIDTGTEKFTDNYSLDKILTKLARPRKRLTEFIFKMTSKQKEQGSCNAISTLRFAFLKSPTRILGDTENKRQVTGVQFQQNQYNNEFIESSESLNTEETLNAIPCKPIVENKVEVIPADLVIRSIGYKNVNIDEDIPFDKKNGVVLNVEGKVTDRDGLYCTGWIKRGPRGVIVDTTTDAIQTAKKICTDITGCTSDQLRNEKQGGPEIIRLLSERNVKYVDKFGWKKIDEEEVRRGQLVGKPRDKIQKIDEMLEIAFSK